MIAIQKLTVEINPPIKALKNVSINFERGKIHALVGPNGSGKTTILKSITGLYKPAAGGLIHVDELDLTTLSNMQRAKVLSYVESQHFAAFPYTVGDIITWGRWIHHRGRPSEFDHKAVAQSAEMLNLQELVDKPFTDLSTGERKKALLAQSLASGARHFIWDEPFSPLDLGTSTKTIGVLKNLCGAGATFVISFHDIPFAFRHANTITVINAGEINWSGPATDDCAIRAVEDVFGVKANVGGIYFS